MKKPKMTGGVTAPQVKSFVPLAFSPLLNIKIIEGGTR